MTVGELREKLKDLPDEMLVLYLGDFGSTYGLGFKTSEIVTGSFHQWGMHGINESIGDFKPDEEPVNAIVIQ